MKSAIIIILSSHLLGKLPSAKPHAELLWCVVLFLNGIAF